MGKLLGIFVVVSILGVLFYGGTTENLRSVNVEQDSKYGKQFHREQRLRDGDIIFQTSTSSQSEAIQLATHSKYSHLGIIYEQKGQFFVYEAVQPVTLTPINKWINRGANRHYVVKRLKNSEQVLTEPVLIQMKKIGEQFDGKSYDLYFEWSDEKMYCSELVWKIYKQATGIEIGKLERLSDFDLSHPVVRSKIKERYGDAIPTNELVISPAALFESEKLVTVEEQ